MISKPNGIRLFFYLLALAGALYYPIRKIVAIEYPAIPPQSYRFKVQAYDPYDPMRGRYVQLRLEPASVEAPERKEAWKLYGKRMYAELGVGDDGFAVVARLVENQSECDKNKDYVEVTYQGNHGHWDKEKKRTTAPFKDHFRLPFHRFYLNETLALEADALVQNLTREKSGEVVLTVKIYRDGNYAVEELLVGGRPIAELIREQMKNAASGKK